MPTFSFLPAPTGVTSHLQRKSRTLPYRLPLTGQALGFGTVLDARLLSMPYRSTSELLRTL